MTARYLVLLETFIPAEQRREVARRLNIGAYEQLMRLKPLLELERPLREAIHHGFMTDKVGLKLGSFSKEDRLFLFDLFQRLTLNKNKQRRVLELVQIIIATKGGSIRNLFKEEFSDLFAEEDQGNTPQLGAKLLRRLYEQSHPLSSQSEKAFGAWKQGLKLPPSCDVTHSPSFETDQVTLSIQFESDKKMSSAWEKIKRFLQ